VSGARRTRREIGAAVRVSLFAVALAAAGAGGWVGGHQVAHTGIGPFDSILHRSDTGHRSDAFTERTRKTAPQ
jgi:hypothetical protein